MAGNDPEEWKRTCMVTASGQLYVLGTYVFATLCNGAKHTRKGKGSIQSMVAATLQVLDEHVMLDRFVPKDGPTPDATQPVYLDISGVRNPSTKARNVRYRLAASAGWRAKFTIVWDKTIVAREQMKAVVHDAGLLVGLANGRSIGYGRFEVVSFDDAEKANAA